MNYGTISSRKGVGDDGVIVADEAIPDDVSSSTKNKKKKTFLELFKSFQSKNKSAVIQVDDLFKLIKHKTDILDRINFKTCNSDDYSEFLSDLRKIPVSLQDKRQLLKKLYQEQHSVEKRMSKGPRHRDSIGSFAWYNFKQGLIRFKSNVMAFFRLLGSPLKMQIVKIEKNYGREISSYFHYLKWLIVANLVALIFLLLPFIIIPHIVVIHDNLKETQANIYNYSSCIESKQDEYISNNKIKISFFDILVGNNLIKLAFYGCFSNRTHNLIASNPNSYYNMPYAYLLVVIVYFLYWLYKTASRLSKEISQNFIQTNVILNKTFFVNIVFFNWDFALSNQNAAKEKRHQIYREFVENALIIKNQNKFKSNDSRNLVLFSTNALYLIICGGIGVGIYYFMLSNELQQVTNDEKNIILAVFICSINYVIPYLCKVLSYCEKLQKANEIALNLFRVFIIQVISIGFAIGTTIVLSDKAKCYETRIAQLVYTIAIIDFLFFLLDSLIVIVKEIFIDSLIKTFKPSYNRDFDIAFYTFNSIFSQSIIWIGTYYSPFLTILQFLKLLIVFFVESLLVRICYKPSKNAWASRKIRIFFLIMSLVAFLLVAIGIGYLNIAHASSKSCGPFTDVLNPTPYDYIFKLRSEIEASSKTISTLLVVLLSPGVISFILFLLSVGLYASYIRMSGYKETVDLLRILHQDQKKRRNKLTSRKNFLQREVDEYKKTIGEEALRANEEELINNENESFEDKNENDAEDNGNAHVEQVDEQSKYEDRMSVYADEVNEHQVTVKKKRNNHRPESNQSFNDAKSDLASNRKLRKGKTLVFQEDFNDDNVSISTSSRQANRKPKKHRQNRDHEEYDTNQVDDEFVRIDKVRGKPRKVQNIDEIEPVDEQIANNYESDNTSQRRYDYKKQDRRHRRKQGDDYDTQSKTSDQDDVHF